MGRGTDIRCEIVKKLLVIEPRTSGWQLEMNAVVWHDSETPAKGKPVKLDIRPWNADHTQCGKGITLTIDNMKKIIGFYEEFGSTEIDDWVKEETIC